MTVKDVYRNLKPLRVIKRLQGRFDSSEKLKFPASACRQHIHRELIQTPPPTWLIYAENRDQQHAPKHATWDYSWKYDSILITKLQTVPYTIVV